MLKPKICDQYELNFDLFTDHNLQSVSQPALQIVPSTKEETIVWTDKQAGILMEAMIERSIAIIKAASVRSSWFAEELAWLYSDDKKHPFSAARCAAEAKLNLDALRQGLDYALPQEKRDRLRLIDNGLYDGGLNYEKVPIKKKSWAERPMYSMA